MIDVNEISELLRTNPVDIKGAYVARELIDEGLATADDVWIVPEGLFARSFERDVELINDELLPESDESILKIHVVSEGITDMIPPGVIYQPEINREERTSEVMIKEAQNHSNDISDARRFFLPFDVAFRRTHLDLERLENRSLTDTYNYFSKELYTCLWPDLKLDLEAHQRTLFLELSMNLHHAAGDLVVMSYYLENILGYPVHIGQYDEKENQLKLNHQETSLGSTMLGFDFMPFSKFRSAYHYQITIGPIPSADMTQFRHHEPVGSSYRILKFLCDLLIPIEFTWEVELVTQERNFQLNKKKETGVLGYSTVLG